MATSGCGPTSLAIGLENIGIHADPAKIAKAALDPKVRAREAEGTNMQKLCTWATREFGLELLYLGQSDAVPFELSHNTGRSFIIANTAGDHDGHTGVFSSGGHYICLLNSGKTEYLVADPYDYPGKFDKPGREGVTRIRKGLLKCKHEIVHNDVRGPYIVMWIPEKPEK